MNQIIKTKRYSESFKLKVVEEIESGDLSLSEARFKYRITGGSTIRDWLNKYGSGKVESGVIRITMKNEEERISELEKALATERMGNMLLSAQLKSYQRLVPNFKKKLNSKELEKFEENERKLKEKLL